MAIGTNAQVREVVSEVVSKEKQDALFALTSPALLMTPGASVDSVALGSRLGGRPLAIAGTPWPVSEDGPLELLAQLDLAEVAHTWPGGPLPNHGLLSFYYDTREPSWTYRYPDPAKWRVRWEVGEVRPLPRQAPDHRDAAQACGIRWEPAMTLPRPTEDDCVFQNLGLLSELAAADRAMGGGPAFHQLLGWPHLLQGSMTTTCQRESAFVLDDTTRFDPDEALSEADWEALDDATKAADWRLLLQLGTDVDRGWRWGAGGGLYFWIRAQDLAAARFDRAWAVVQC